jgi:hypothetical protein
MQLNELVNFIVKLIPYGQSLRMINSIEANKLQFRKPKGGQTIDSFISSSGKYATTPKQVTNISSGRL